MVPTGASDGGGVKEIVTYSFEFKLADGNTFQITEAGDGIPVTGVTVTPTTSTLIAAGSSTTFTVNIAPADAGRQGIYCFVFRTCARYSGLLR